jgi:hypothetical protein
MVTYTYSNALIPAGATIMFVGDCTDIFLCCFKMTVDCFKNDWFSAPGFFSMLFSWLYLRMFVYPVYLITGLYF